MNNQHLKTFLTTLFVFILSISFSFAQNDSSGMQDSMKMGHNHMHKMGMKPDSNKVMQMDTTKSNKDSIVREGVIDLNAIDENKDGKVYQDGMDFNVISDKPGKCPLCGMTLQEVSLEKAKDVLIKNNFKVKEN